MAKNILIRCDASKNIGLGHIVRCIALAKKFRENGDNVFFAIKNNDISIEKLKDEKFQIIIVKDINFNYYDWIESLLKEKQINIFIGDVRDGFPVELIDFMKKNKILSIAIDEPSEYAKQCDICFFPPHSIIDKALYNGKVYQGLEYVILREEFYKSSKKIKNELPNILVMMGGTDSFNMTLPVVKSLDQSNEEFVMNVILSNKHKDIKELENFIVKSNHKIYIHNNIDNMSFFLDSIDFAVGQFGTVAYEYICKNIPAIYVVRDEKEKINYFKDNSFALINKIEELELSKLFQLSFKKVKYDNQIYKIIKEEYNGN